MKIEMENYLTDYIQSLNVEIKHRREASSKLVCEANKLRGYLISQGNYDALERTTGAHKSIWRTIARNNHKMFEIKRRIIRCKAYNNIHEKYEFDHASGKFIPRYKFK